jgi:chitin disaccharide deacetylase
MVFMEDSFRAAELAREIGIDTGLHLNFSERFTAQSCNPLVASYQDRIIRFLARSRYALVLYHPGLRQAFRCLFEAQCQEFIRLFGVPPSHFDGHHHMHLCANMLIEAIIPKGQKVRRNCSLAWGDKSLPNRAYRALVDRWQKSRYVMPDYLFSLPDCLRRGRLEYAVNLAATAAVEVECHPEMTEDYEWLIGEEGLKAFAGRRLGTYGELAAR